MCGIVGIVSNKSVSSSIINALKKLEYRGYDSAGISTLNNGFIDEKKCSGRVQNLENILFENPSLGDIGIGHVRWATHGGPNKTNAHPHSTEKVSVVHNGIIENSDKLKTEYEQKGYSFKSQTDTEVITIILTDYLKTENLIDGIHKTLNKLEGSFALGVLFKDFNDVVVGARRGSPLAVGYGHNENFIGSDSYALKSMTNKISYLDDGDFCLLFKEKVEFYNSEKKKINKEIFELSSEDSIADKGDFKDFMSKEIDEQNETTKKCINEYVDKSRDEINIYNIPIESKQINKIRLIACGTAYHSCLMAKYWIEEFTSIDVEADIASEFRYRNVKLNKSDLYIFVSQSGETADTYAALEKCKKNGVKTCGIVNVVESSIARLSDFVLPIHAGPEIGVASTKAFIGQMLVLLLLTLKISKDRNDLNIKEYKRIIKDIQRLPYYIKQTLLKQNEIQEIARDFINAKGTMYLGRGYSYPIAMEGALKLKELSYIHAEGYAAGEMKHGPLALIEDGMPIVVLAPKDRFFEKTVSNMQEVIARGGKVLMITNDTSETLNENIRFKFQIPDSTSFISAFLLTIPVQFLAYHVALLKNCDIDKPRNLAKSVTVE
ncbi:MAG: glutamine--fructose-6-phosphate transaminase (isomerizing) [Rickettsiales bacterium TMED289]|nr:MAG: glutamine--fructose-6-phosphate transaminase (isomerizing) [Rickettsiales bacterium TMED289]